MRYGCKKHIPAVFMQASLFLQSSRGNYFNYFTKIEEHYQRRKHAVLLTLIGNFDRNVEECGHSA